MGEGLSAAEVGKGIAEHRHETTRADLISIVEAVLLATVALFAGWSGFALGEVEHRVTAAARAVGDRPCGGQPRRPRGDGEPQLRLVDVQRVVHRVRRRRRGGHGRRRNGGSGPSSRWRSTRGGQRIPTRIPTRPRARRSCPSTSSPTPCARPRSTIAADEKYTEGQKAATNADDYVRITVFLATVLFLVGISGHFRLKAARYGLVTVGVIVLIVAVATLTTLPGPP